MLSLGLPRTTKVMLVFPRGRPYFLPFGVLALAGDSGIIPPQDCGGSTHEFQGSSGSLG
ncbi:MAG: hypothetical protein ACI9OO_001572 [Bacteroidia bacterium]|jgi:hypothetical protein